MKEWTGYIIDFKKGNSFQKEGKWRKNYSRYFRLIFSNKYYLLLLLFFSIFLSVLSIASAMIYQKIIDDYIIGNTREGKQDNLFRAMNEQMDTLFVNVEKVFIAFLSIVFIQMLFSIVRGLFVLKLSRKVDKELMEQYFQRLLHLPFSFFQYRESGEILSRFQDISDVRFLVSGAGITLIMDFLSMISGGIILYSIDGTLFSLVLVIVILYLGIVLLYKNAIQSRNQKVKENYTKVLSTLKESTDGIVTLKSLFSEDKRLQVFKERVDCFLRENYLLGILQHFMHTKIMGIEAICMILVLWSGSNRVIDGKISLGVLITFETLVYFFMNPVKSLIEMYPTIQKTSISLERLGDVMDTRTEDELATRNIEEGLIFEEVTLENVSFAYNDRTEVLTNINYLLQANQKYVIMGDNGSGKSTLLQLLSGMLLAASGEIRIDGFPINQISLKTLRKNIVYVPQSTFLLNGTIRENLLLGNPKIEEEIFQKICSGCEIPEVLEKINGDLSYNLNENGQNLSGGQRQKIALARALILQPKILLLDEAMNQLSESSAKRISQFILKAFPEMMLIQVVHHLNILEDSYEEIWMKN